MFLFSDTIANNIRFGVDEEHGTKEAIEKAAIQADIYANIIQLPDGFETEIGERGVTLSGGQKQRISMARALITNPEILILDDSLSAVDTETEDTILKHLDSFMEGRTTIIISHRISSIKNCDHILVLDEGEIIESGTHQENMKHEGLYKMLYEQQLLEERVNN